MKNEILGLESKLTELGKELTRLQGEITKRDTEEVNRLYNEIKEIDSEFSKDTVVKLEQCPIKQKTILQTYLDNLKRLKPKFTVGAVVAPSDAERMNKLSLEAFGTSTEELEKQLASLEKGGKS